MTPFIGKQGSEYKFQNEIIAAMIANGRLLISAAVAGKIDVRGWEAPHE